MILEHIFLSLTNQCSHIFLSFNFLTRRNCTIVIIKRFEQLEEISKTFLTIGEHSENIWRTIGEQSENNQRTIGEQSEEKRRRKIRSNNHEI